MKKINKFLLVAALSTPLLTSCIDETFPTSSATEDQVTSSDKAVEAMLWGMPGRLNQYQTISDAAYDWGYGSFMHMRDVMTEEYVVTASSYDWYTTWEFNRNAGPNYLSTQTHWYLYYQLVQAPNKLIKAIKDLAEPTEGQLGALACGYAYRAFLFLDMARMYEFLPAQVNSGEYSGKLAEPITVFNAVKGDSVTFTSLEGLTCPIVDENITEETSRNNPRATHKEMFDFILNDLNEAEKNIDKLTVSTKTLPRKAAVYGLKARLYMWNEDYANAKVYARKAIDAENHSPLTKDEWLNKTSGFNTLSTSSWIWGSSMIKEDDVVQSGILNWTSWSSNEASYGYASAGPISCVFNHFYDKIDNNDFRKLSWKAPQGSKLAGKEEYIDKAAFEKFPDYTSLKFRPGSGNTEDYQIGSVCSYPLMRVEEMYFIEMEAAAHLNAAEGLELLNNFMTTYRFKQYKTKAQSKEEVIDEIFFQKRVEFWGEGISFFDYKRLNKSVTRIYGDSNFAPSAQFNTNGRPAWMNLCIVQSEENNNRALVGLGNPDPSGKY